MTSYDVIVVGLGAVGASTTLALARGGARVLGIEQFVPPHAYGSSHGGSRIIREAYFEGSDYVPLVRRAYEFRTGERVSGWSANHSGITVQTSAGSTSAASLVLAAGAWMPGMLGEHDLGAWDLGLWVERQVMHWFPPAPTRPPLAGAHAPVTVWQLAAHRVIYTTPDLGEGSKIAIHHGGEPATADAVRRDVSGSEIREIEGIVARYIPGVDPRVRRSATCMYTNTADQHFLIDRHPGHANVVIASACSGHGFKFAPAVGELTARLAIDAGALPPDLFAARRRSR